MTDERQPETLEEAQREFNEAQLGVGNPRHLRIALAIVDGTKPTAAARAQGYSVRNAAKTGSRVSHLPEVRRLVEAGRNLRRFESGVDLGHVDRSEVVNVLREIMNDQGAKASDRIKAAKELALLHAMHEPPRKDPEEAKPPVRIAIVGVEAPAIQWEKDAKTGRMLPVVPDRPFIEHDPQEG